MEEGKKIVDTAVDGDLEHAISSNWAYDHAADIDAHMPDLRQKLRTGSYFTSPFYFLGGTEALVANVLTAHPFFIPRPMTFDRIAIQVTAGDAGKKARLGIYNDGTNLYPGTLVVDGGEISLTDTGIIAATIDESLAAGLYWLAIVADGVATIRSLKFDYHGSTLLGLLVTNFAYGGVGWTVAQAYGALPDPFTAAGTIVADAEGFLVAVRLSSLD